MFEGEPRKLHFPLDRAEQLEATTPEDESVDGLPSFPEDSDERITITFELSLNEFVALATAVDVGSDIAFGKDATKVWWIWVRSVSSVPICAAINNCITTDADTQEALRNQLLSDPDFLRDMQEQITAGQKMGPGEITQPVIQGCDKDNLWAGVIGMIQQMDRNNTDFLEQIEILTNPIERVTGITRLIPQLKTADALFDFVNELVSNIQENYAAEYTTAYENEISCQMFCMALENGSGGCAMSFEEIYNVFRDRLVASFTIESAFADVIQYLATGTFSGTQVCDFMFMLQLQCINSASKFLAIDLLSLQQMFQVGESEPNRGWTTLCTDCPDEWSHTFDFTLTENEFSAIYGSYEVGVGFIQGQVYSDPLYYTALSFSRAVSVSITGFDVLYSMSGVTGDPQTDRIWVNTDTPTNYVASQTNANGENRVMTWNGDLRAVTAVGFTAAVSACYGTWCGGLLSVESITLRGVGTDPFA